MNLASIATTDLVEIAPSDTNDKAIALMEEHDIHHLPVVKDGRPVGIVSDRDLLRSVGWMTSAARTDLHDGEIIGPRFVSDVMSSPVHMLSPDEPVTAGAHLMLREEIGAIVLVADETLAGLVAESDILNCFLDGQAHFGSTKWRFEKVVNHMAANVFSLAPKDPVIRATRLMKDKNIRHVPIVEHDHVVGVVSDRDIRKSCFRERVNWLNDDERTESSRTNLRDVMSPKPLYVAPSATIADAASRMIHARIGAMPVVEQGRLRGIITETDLLRAFIHADD